MADLMVMPCTTCDQCLLSCDNIGCFQDMYFYQLPEHAHYYSELVNGLAAGGDAAIAAEHATVRVLSRLMFCKCPCQDIHRPASVATSALPRACSSDIGWCCCPCKYQARARLASHLVHAGAFGAQKCCIMVSANMHLDTIRHRTQLCFITIVAGRRPVQRDGRWALGAGCWNAAGQEDDDWRLGHIPVRLRAHAGRGHDRHGRGCAQTHQAGMVYPVGARCTCWPDETQQPSSACCRGETGSLVMRYWSCVDH